MYMLQLALQAAVPKCAFPRVSSEKSGGTMLVALASSYNEQETRNPVIAMGHLINATWNILRDLIQYSEV